MSEDVWSAQDTDPDTIEAALRELLRERHAADRAVAPARVLNLVVVVDRAWKEEVSTRLQQVGRYHASRTILCSVQPGRETLDAVATIAYEDAAPGGIRPVRECVDLDIGPEHIPQLDSIVDPILVSELPTLVWSPDGHHDAVRALLPLTDVILLDSDLQETDNCLAWAAQLRESAYLVDLAWLRTTPWRERLASSFELPARSYALGRLNGLRVRHHPGSPASAALLAGWLASRLNWEATPLQAGEGWEWEGTAQAGDRQVEISLLAVEQEAPGLAGVTVGWEGDCSLSLDRAPGGLCAHERHAGGDEQTWQVLGASRGEGGILGEGVRQALLRDPTYAPALDRALVLRGMAGSN
jgi:glucose-6-phosphate dehydrogenase assembly protein OpcA